MGAKEKAYNLHDTVVPEAYCSPFIHQADTAFVWIYLLNLRLGLILVLSTVDLSEL